MLVNNRKQMFFLPEISVYLVFKNIVDVTSSFQPGFKTGRSFTSPHHPNKWKSSAHWKKSTFLLRFIREVRSQGKLLSPNLERLTGEYIYGESQLQSELCENQHWSRENLNCNSWISGDKSESKTPGGLSHGSHTFVSFTSRSSILWRWEKNLLVLVAGGTGKGTILKYTMIFCSS